MEIKGEKILIATLILHPSLVTNFPYGLLALAKGCQIAHAWQRVLIPTLKYHVFSLEELKN